MTWTDGGQEAGEERDLLVGGYTARRIVELEINPVQGKFDSSHLREVHSRIFQDLPGLGFQGTSPGEYRLESPVGRDWVKQRRLETVDVTANMAYSAMNSVARAQLETVLKRAVPESLAELGPEKFVQQLAEIYVNLDYLHPFLDGNSRTLRSFTRQLARGAGYELDWSVFNASPIARDMLYIARCKSVNTLALPQKGNYTADAKAANQTCDTHNTS